MDDWHYRLIFDLVQKTRNSRKDHLLKVVKFQNLVKMLLCIGNMALQSLQIFLNCITVRAKIATSFRLKNGSTMVAQKWCVPQLVEHWDSKPKIAVPIRTYLE